MSKTYRRTDTEQFRKELSEAMSISPTRRAQEERDALRQVRDFLLETHDEGVSDDMFDIMGGAVFPIHRLDDEYVMPKAVI